MNYNDLFELDPYSLTKSEKEAFFDVHLNELVEYHFEHCHPYASILNALGEQPGQSSPFRELPFLPVRLFICKVNHQLVIFSATSNFWGHRF